MMEDLFGQIECRSRSDSIVMRILRSAMDKTHEKLQFKDGPIEFIHERTLFYKLAAILVEGGLEIIEEESKVLEGGVDEILSELMEIREWLRGRIQEMEQLIVDKDGELVQRFENEVKLWQAIDQKDGELVYLHEKLRRGENEDGDIEKLRSDVDQQVLKIKQELEEEKRVLIRSRKSSPSLFMKEVESFDSVKPQSEFSVRRMSSDIDVLKETLDVAFGRMQSAEVLPLERQWRWGVEKDVESILVRGFVGDLQRSFDVQVKKIQEGNLVDLMGEMRALLCELRDSIGGNESETSLNEVRRTTSASFLDFSCLDNLVKDDDSGKSNLVAKMIKNHESIICKQREQDSRKMKERIKKDKENSRLKKRIQDAVSKLDSFKKTNIANEHDSVDKLDTQIQMDIYNVFMREMAAFSLEASIRENIHHFVIMEAVKDMSQSRLQKHVSFQERTPRSRRLETEGDESLIDKLDSLLRCFEAEEDLMLKASSIIKEHSASNSLIILNCEEMDERDAIEWLITDDESTFCSVSDKLERALQQLYTSKELLVELEQTLEVSDDFGEAIEHELRDDRVDHAHEFDDVLATIMEFQKQFNNVEQMLHENLKAKSLRVEVLKHQLDALIQPISLMRTRKLLYKKAFVSRCHNLRLAENEVDALGDQVDSLLYLLERIYTLLNRNATVLSRHFKVHDILKLIKLELNNGRSCKT